MLGLYTPVLLLQAFCIYHAYKHNAEQRWYWFILLFPGVGCGIYLFDRFYNRNNINSLTESVKGVVNSNYRIEQLEKAFRFSDTLKNRLALADAYVTYNRYSDAITLYQNSLTGFMAEDPDLRMKLLYTYFLNRSYSQTVEIGRALESEKSFKNATQRLAYAWALHHEGKTEIAESIFDDMDKPFTNYQHRMEYCKFLHSINKPEKLKIKITNLLDEFEHIRGAERKLYRDIIHETKVLYAACANN